MAAVSHGGELVSVADLEQALSCSSIDTVLAEKTFQQAVAIEFQMKPYVV